MKATLGDVLDKVEEFDRLKDLIRHSRSIPRDGRVSEERIEREAQKFPKWQSGVQKLDDDYGGFYGLSIIGGGTGAGKSMLALGSSLLAAEAGWCVVYFDGENGARIVRDRFVRWYGEHEASAAMQRLAGYWHRFSVLPGASIDDFIARILHAYDYRHCGVLAVIDSLNTLSEFNAQTAQESFDALRAMTFWLDSLVRQSHGRFSCLALSELNGTGALKGRKQEYIANLVLRMEADADTEDVVRLTITKSRDERAGDLGLHLRDWRTGRFTPPRMAS